MKNPIKAISNYRKIIHEQGFYGMEAFRIFFDLRYCRKKFHCTPNEYFYYRFYNLKNRFRKNYLLKYHQRARYMLVDKGCKIISHKDLQYEGFRDMIKRDWLIVTADNINEVESFIQKHGKVIFKPYNGSQGRGIFAFTSDELENNLLELHPEIIKKKYICEEYVIQHPQLAAFNPGSVNTVRVTTLCDGENVKFVFGSLRTGAGDGVCDNMSIGGVGAAVDMETGMLVTAGIDFEQHQHLYHPVTGTKILGFEIPFWKEVKEMVRECALRAKDAAVVGWDIAITENGPCLIEANCRPAAGKSAQFAMGKPHGEEIIKYIDENWKKYHPKLSRQCKKYMKRWE